MKCVLATSMPFFHQGVPSSPDDVLLAQSLREQGVQVDVVPWETTNYDWSEPDVVVVRSTWNAHLYPREYLTWAKRVEASSVLCNPFTVIRWNLDKWKYFMDLQGCGIPIMPSLHFMKGEHVHLAHHLTMKGWRRAVLKPSIGANSFATHVVEHEDSQSLSLAQEHLNHHLGERDMLLQPYLHNIAKRAERNHVFIDGTWSHTFSKTPFRVRTANAPEQEEYIVRPPEDELEIAQRTVRATELLLQTHLLFARVDIVHNDTGSLNVLELEINEPMLHLEMGSSCSLLTHAILRRVEAVRKEKSKEHFARVTREGLSYTC